jgi:hypothetical protein
MHRCPLISAIARGATVWVWATLLVACSAMGKPGSTASPSPPNTPLAATATPDTTRSPSLIPTVLPTASPSGATPSSTPPPGYVAVDGLPITVLASDAADALFTEVETCVSSAGFTVRFPASWYTNAKTATAPACSWFAPEPFDPSIRPIAVRPPPPDGVWISLEVFDGSAGYVGETPIFLIEQLRIGGYDAHRAEYGPSIGGLIGSPSEDRTYWYVIPFAYDGPTFIAGTNNTVAEDYPLAKAALDRIVASVTFQQPATP